MACTVPTMSALWLMVCLLLSPAESIKVHHDSVSSSSMEEMMATAAEVAEVAYQQGRISPNMRKALSNATYYHEAVLDAGLPWSLVETQQHIHQTALGLLSSNTSVNAKQESKRGRFARIFDKEMKEFFDAAKRKSGLVDAMANAVAQDYSTSMGASDYIGHALGGAAFVIGLSAPMLAGVGALAAFFVLDMLGEVGFFGPSNEEVLYDQIMKEMGAYVDKSIVMANVYFIRSNLESLAEELTWMPSLLGGVAGSAEEAKEKVKKIPDAEKHSMLMFLITCQHDAAKISYEIRNSQHCQEEETSESPRWVTSVAPLAEFVVMLQTTLISGIGKHEMVQQSNLAANRIQHLLTGEGGRSWEAWTTRCLPRVKKFYRETLKWGQKTVTPVAMRGRQKAYQKTTESSQGLDGENGGQVISPKCYFGTCNSNGGCNSQVRLCTSEDMEKYINIMYDKKVLLVKHVKKFYVYSLGHIDKDDDGTKWVKINQWTSGMYEKNTGAYGTVHTEGPGDGKLADTLISKEMALNKIGGYNYFKVTSTTASENLYIKTTSSSYVDTSPRFGFPEDVIYDLGHWGSWTFRWTYQNVGTKLPTHWHNLWNKVMFESWGFRNRDQSCNRWFMGHDGDECYKWDYGKNTNNRCFSGGYHCKYGARSDHAPLKDIQMYLKIIY